MDVRVIRYRFVFGDGRVEDFRVRVDEQSVEQVYDDGRTPPAWAALEVHQCPNCPLSADRHPYCPLAKSLAVPVERLGDVLSFDQVRVEVLTPERGYLRKTSAQAAISSLLGLVIGTSGCPHTYIFKPMARFHLPFSSADETTYRAVGSYLLGQYFRRHDGEEVDLDLTGLVSAYRAIEVVNRHMAERLRTVVARDGTVNAIVMLDMFAKNTPAAVEDALEELRPLYTS